MKKLKWPVMLLATVAGVVICFLGIPILLNWLFKTPALAPVLAAEWSAGDALGYVGGTLAFIGAMFLGWNTWKQNRDLQNRQDDSFIAENSCMALIDKVKFKGFSQKCVNFDCHSEAIAVTDISDASVQDYGTFECEILLHPTKNSPVVVRVLNAFLLVGNHPLNFGKYDECYTRMAIGKNGSRFNLTLVMSPDDKRLVAPFIKAGRHEITLETQIELVSDRYVSTILKCRSTFKPKQCPDGLKYSSDEDTTMCFWYGNRIVEPSSLNYRFQFPEEKANDQDEI